MLYCCGGSLPLHDWLWSGAHHQSPQRSQPASNVPSATTHSSRPIVAPIGLTPEALTPQRMTIANPVTPAVTIADFGLPRYFGAGGCWDATEHRLPEAGAPARMGR